MTAECVSCHEVVRLAADAHVVQPACGHTLHHACSRRLDAHHRTACPACPDLAMSHGAALARDGYSVLGDSDLDRRTDILRALEMGELQAGEAAARAPPPHARAEAASDPVMCGQASPYAAAAAGGGGEQPPPPRSGAGALVSFSRAVVSAVTGGSTALAAVLPPAAIPHAAGGGVCTSGECGGPAYCMHVHTPVPLNTRAVHDWATYALPRPYDVSAAAQDTLRALFVAGATARDLERCGANAEMLALCGVSLDHLVRAARLPLRSLVDALHLTWPRLLALGFTLDHLADRAAYPLLPLMRSCALDSTHVCAFPTTYAYLRDSLRLSTSELVALGFDAPLLAYLCMSGTELVHALLADAAGGGDNEMDFHARWYVDHLRITPGLLAHLHAATEATGITPAERRAWSALLAAAQQQ